MDWDGDLSCRLAKPGVPTAMTVTRILLEGEATVAKKKAAAKKAVKKVAKKAPAKKAPAKKATKKAAKKKAAAPSA